MVLERQRDRELERQVKRQRDRETERQLEVSLTGCLVDSARALDSMLLERRRDRELERQREVL